MKIKLQTMFTHNWRTLLLLCTLITASQGVWGTEWSIRGEFNGWSGNATLENGGSREIFLEEGSHEFKVVEDGSTWYGCGDGIDASGDFTFTTSGGNCALNASSSGLYKFEVIKSGSDAVVTVTYPSCTPYTIYFDNTNTNWDNVYICFYSGEYWDSNNGSGSSQGSVSYVGDPDEMENTTGNIWTYTNAYCCSKVAFIKDNQTNYGNFWNTEAVYSDGSNFNVTGSLSESTPLCTPSTDKEQKNGETVWYYNGAWGSLCTTPTVTPTGASRCGTGTVTLTASTTGGTISWWAASSGGDALGTGESYTTGSINTTTIYYVSATDGTCTSDRVAVTATVNALPSAGSISGSAKACSGEREVMLELGSYTSSGTSIKWQYNTGSGWNDFTYAATTDSLYRRQTAQTDYHAVVKNTTTNCSSTSDAYTVAMKKPMALTSIILSPDHICEEGTSTITPDGLDIEDGGDIAYTSGTPAKATVDGTTITGVAVGSSVITATVSGGCGSTVTKTATIYVDDAPTAYTLSASGESEAYICSAGGTLTLSDSQSGYSYQLKKDGSNYGDAKAGTGSALVFTVYESGDYTCEAYLTGSPDCKTSMTGTVTLHLSLTPNLLPATPTVRNFEPVVITSINTDIETWTITNGGEAVTDRTAYLYNITSNSATVKALKAASSYTVTATTSGGCSNTVTVTAVDYAETCN